MCLKLTSEHSVFLTNQLMGRATAFMCSSCSFPISFYENFHTTRNISPRVWIFWVCVIFKYHLVFIRYGSGASATTLFYRGTSTG